MALRNKSTNFQLKTQPYQAQWHGAVEQIKRVIEEIIPYVDESFELAESNPEPINLQNYITQICVLFNNVDCIIPKDQKDNYVLILTKLKQCKRSLHSKVTQEYYFNVLDGANFLDRKLRDFLQDRALLYRIFQKDMTPSNVKELLKYVPKDKVDAMIKNSPLLSKYFDKKEFAEEFDKFLEEGVDDDADN